MFSRYLTGQGAITLGPTVDRFLTTQERHQVYAAASKPTASVGGIRINKVCVHVRKNTLCGRHLGLMNGDRNSGPVLSIRGQKASGSGYTRRVRFCTEPYKMVTHASFSGTCTGVIFH